MKNFEYIHIGTLIRQRAEELEMGEQQLCKFFNFTEREIKGMYQLESLDSDVLLRWSKLLEFDFFRNYSTHLILFSPPDSGRYVPAGTQMPQFRKNIYTSEVIDFILGLIEKGEKTKQQDPQNHPLKVDLKI